MMAHPDEGFFFWMAPQAHPDGAPGFLQFKSLYLQALLLADSKGIWAHFAKNQTSGPFVGYPDSWYHLDRNLLLDGGSSRCGPLSSGSF